MIEDINNYRQNHPSLVANDLEALVPEREVVLHILKYRGINKWLRVRRLLIQLKSRWKEQINQLQQEKRNHKKGSKEYYKLVGYVEALTNCRQQIRALCHSPRDVVFPDSPRDFGSFCELPFDFPQRPHKKWFYKYDSGIFGEHGIKE